ncbi:MAG TPA: type VI secretion system contractile sheath large subunit [Gemmatimonadaceae bacterium]|nr:type VI secretion system contractile sheath large subunit [Gemmatimonadaceae bacterium]
MSGAPHRILVMGEFSGTRARGATLGTRRPVRVDRDSIDDAIASFRPSVTVPLSSGRQVATDFSSLEEFHPDALYTRLPVFRELRSAAVNANATVRLSSPTPLGGVLDAILADTPMPPPGVSLGAIGGAASNEAADSLDEFVRRAVSPHLVAAPSAAERTVAVQGDAVVAAALREVIHHPDYRRIERLWRGVDFLTRRLDTDSELQVWMLDVSAADLVEAPADQTLGAQLIQTLIMASGGDSASSGWSVVVFPHEFDDTPEDLRLLELLGRVSARLGATLLAGASPRLLGADTSSALPEPDTWRESSMLWANLRHSDVARYIGLTAPRLLARLPYGAEADPCEVVRFEEIASDDVELCWLSGSFGAALLAADALQRNDSFANHARDIEDLPQHLSRHDGEFVSTPCAEVLLFERSIEAILDRGIMPLVSKKDDDVVRLARLQSIAAPLAPLAPWGSRDA